MNLCPHDGFHGPILSFGNRNFELDDRTAAYWLNILSNFMWHQKWTTTQYNPDTDPMQGDE